MMSETYTIDAETRQSQFGASDPSASAWVSANAGSGKTHVLTQRVIRLLLAGNAPDRILCLTFTKAAAAEMKSRVFKTLSEWTVLDDAKLDQAILEMTDTAVNAKDRVLARQLFAHALDTPGGLKIQTIHAFCESLLHQFPLEANVPARFRTIEESEQNALIEHARRDVLSDAFSGSKDVARHYATLVTTASDSAIEKGLDFLINQRHQFDTWLRKDNQDPFFGLLSTIGADAGASTQEYARELIDGAPISSGRIKEIISALRVADGKSDHASAEALETWISGIDADKAVDAVYPAFFTREQTQRKTLCTGAADEELPGAKEDLERLAEFVGQAMDRYRTLERIEDTRHLFAIAAAVLERYDLLKRARGLVDYGDQISRAETLLNRSHIRDWIRFRLDRGIDHVLVDEAQDTSPAQWRIIRAISEDFHTGETATRKGRTLFVVGDDKQSIFSFQDADPAEFHRQWRELEKRVSNANARFENSLLKLSFRSAKDILHAVDRVFENPDNAAGLTVAGEVPTHDSARAKARGEVQIWPLFEPVEAPPPENWLQPIDRISTADPASRLAKRISDAVSDWIGKPLPGDNDPLAYRDILVLVRDRSRIVTALIRQLKANGHIVAGADRLKLAEHIAIEDLLAVGKFCLLQEDDLALAGLLKSPLFGLDEDTLFELCKRNKHESLWAAINRKAQRKSSDLTSSIRDRLEQFLHLSTTENVFGFYARILGQQGGRKEFVARLGAEVEDILDAFLGEALSFSADAVAGLQQFIEQLSRSNPFIKRESDSKRDEIRILTVHGAKGLEAKVVFLVDASKEIVSTQHRPSVIEVETGEAKGALWIPSPKHSVRIANESLEKLDAASEAEYRRLLYVGMTRAADRLIVCGYRGKKAVKSRTWHQMVSEALIPDADETSGLDGEIHSYRWQADPRIESAPPAKTANQTTESPETPIPEWLFRPPTAEPAFLPPLSPSATHAYVEEADFARTAPRISDLFFDRGIAARRGTIIHELLERAPEIAPEDRKAAILAYLHNAHRELEPQHPAILSEVMSVLDDPQFAPVFAPGSKSEVSVSGTLETPLGLRPIAGAIDRLVILEHDVLIVDYKTDRQPPEQISDVRNGYLRQLSLYRHMVTEVFPKRKVHCALLWTEVPHLMVIPESLLDDALNAFTKT